MAEPMKPGRYFIPMDAYLAIPAVNASVLCTLINQCPKAAHFASFLNPNPPPPDDTAASDAGTIAHSLLLEGRDDLVEEIDPRMYPTKSSGNIPDGFTNKEIKAARDMARENGRIPILTSKYQVVKGMVASAREYIASLRTSEPAIWQAFEPNGGSSEETIIFEMDGVLCKMRPDRLNATRDAVIDAKFSGVSAEPSGWARKQLIGMNYWLSASFYKLGLGGDDRISYTFLVVEQEAPHLVSMVGMDPAMFAIGEQKIRWALRRWKECVATNKWPGYPDRICYAAPPVWLEAQWEEQQMDNPFGKPGIDYGSQA